MTEDGLFLVRNTHDFEKKFYIESSILVGYF